MKKPLAARMASIHESMTLALNAHAKQLAAEGRTIYNLTAGELATATPEYIQQAVSQKLHLNKYTPVAGLPELREAIAAHARKFYGLDWIGAESVVVAGGAKPALCAAFLALINPGDEIIVPVPAWMISYRPLIELAGGVVREVQLAIDYDLDLQAIVNTITPKTRAIILNSPGNPTGAIFSKTKLRELAIALADSDITIIADDIYSRLVYEESFMPTPSLPFKNIVIINGFSKSQALTGWRIGYAIADPSVANAMTSLLSHITGNAALPSQYAALAAMERHDTPPQETLDALMRQRQFVARGLDAAGISYQMPNGAFYFFLDIRKFTNDSMTWCERLLSETGVALVPGDAFSAPGFVRLTFVASESVLGPALEQIKKFVSRMAKS